MKRSQNKRANDLLVPLSALGSLRRGYSWGPALLFESSCSQVSALVLYFGCMWQKKSRDYPAPRSTGPSQAAPRSGTFVSSGAEGCGGSSVRKWGTRPAAFSMGCWDELEAVLDPGTSLLVVLVVAGIVTSLWMSPEEMWWSNHESLTSRLGTPRLKSNSQAAPNPPNPTPCQPPQSSGLWGRTIQAPV